MPWFADDSADKEHEPHEPEPRSRRPAGPRYLPSGWIVWIVILLAVLAALFFSRDLTHSDRIEYSVFKSQLLYHRPKNQRPPEEGGPLCNVKRVLIGPSRITGEFYDRDVLPDEWRERLRPNKDGTVPFTTYFQPGEDSELIKQLDEKRVAYDFERESAPWLGPLIVYLLPSLLILGLFLFVLLPRLRDPLGGSFLNAYIKSPAKRYEKGKGRVTFEDVADMENAKQELKEVVEFLKNPERFQRVGCQIPKGVLLVGPPGTGKTLLARAVAGEAGVPFYSISGSEFIQMFVGVGASRVRDLFKTAKDNAPCILFIDEIDAVGRVRGAGLGGGHDEREQTLNQILSEMDGFTPNESVIVIAATNRPDVLDPALLRPGRFDRHITIDRPNWQGRLAILRVHTRGKPLADDVNLEAIARAMIGMTGADLRNLVNEAAILAIREGKDKIDRQCFERAADRVLIGPKREEVLSPQDKRRTAYHEAGHALVAYLEPHADPLFKVTIIPRGRALGVTRFQPEEDRFDHSESYLKAQLIVAMGGRAADRLVFNETTSGAEMDLKHATRLARLMVTHWGMSDKLGPVAYRVGEEHVFLGKEIHEPRDFSEGTAQLIDEEVRRILREADEKALEHLRHHRRELDLLAEALLQREELSKEEVDYLLRHGHLPPEGVPWAEPVAKDASVDGTPATQPADGRSSPSARDSSHWPAGEQAPPAD
ncbi:MAG: cell division protein FtsH [Gemmataceae bacterium]